MTDRDVSMHSAAGAARSADAGSGDAGPRRPSFRAAGLGLAGWTIFVWGQRITNVIADDDLDGFARTWRLAVAVGFTAAAILGGVLLLAKRTQARPFLVGLAAVGSAWWLIRGAQTLFADFSIGFKVVHTVLALVTVGLSALVWRSAKAVGSSPDG